MTIPPLLADPTGPPHVIPEIRVRDVWQSIVRNRALIFTCFALALGVATLYAFRATPVYQTSASIRIDEKQSNFAVLDVLKEISSGSEISTEMEVLRSRTLAEEVIDSLALHVQLIEPQAMVRSSIFSSVHVGRSAPVGDFILRRTTDGRFSFDGSKETFAPGDRVPFGGGWVVLLPSAARHPEIGLRVQAFHDAAKAFSRSMAVTRPSRDANVVVVKYEGTDPSLARDVPNLLALRFIRRRQDIKKTEARSTVAFLHQQLDTLSNQLARAEDSLRVFREASHVISLTEEATAQVRRLSEIEAERTTLETERSALARLLIEVQAASQLAKPEDPSPYRRLLAFPTLLRNPAISELFRSLTAIEDQRSQLLVRRTAQDPDVMAFATRIHELENQIRALGTTYLQGLTNQVASLSTELARFSNELQRVPAKEVQFARLQRRPKVLEEIFTLLQSRLKEAEIVQAVEDPSVRVIDAAIVPTKPIKPVKPLIIGVGALLGLICGLVATFARESMDRTVHSREDLIRVTGIPVLGLIPHISEADPEGRRYAEIGAGMLKRLALVSGTSGTVVPRGTPATGSLEHTFSSRLITGTDPRNAVSEAYRALRTNIMFARPDALPKTLLFTSPMPGDGKSTSAANLATTLAQQGQKVLLLDADLRRGVLNSVFGVPREPGLSNALLGSIDVSTAIRSIDIGDSIELSFLSTGTRPPNPAELLSSSRMKSLLERLTSEYDCVIIDTPPINVVTDAAVLGTSVDGVILVARAAVTHNADLEYAILQLSNVRAQVLGTVLNDFDIRRDARYYGGYSYGYNYYYSASGTD